MNFHAVKINTFNLINVTLLFKKVISFTHLPQKGFANPGYYLENAGHSLTENGLRFVSKDQPEIATRFRLNDKVAGSAIEGI